MQQNGKVQFHCLISVELKERIDKKGIKYAFVVEEGLKFLEGRPEIRRDVEENKADTAKLERALTRMQERIFAQEQEIQRLQSEGN